MLLFLITITEAFGECITRSLSDEDDDNHQPIYRYYFLGLRDADMAFYFPIASWLRTWLPETFCK